MYAIRRAVLTDAEEIASIHVKSWKSAYMELINEKDLANMTFENRKGLWEAILKMKQKDQCTFVIENEEGIVGFVSGGPERTQRFNYDSEIYTIYLLDEFQKKGLGAKLLKAFANEMKSNNFKSILVWILNENPSSQFYVRYNAKSVGEEATTIGVGHYTETAYGWESIDDLLAIL